MKRLLPVWGAMLACSLMVRADTIPLYINDGIVAQDPADQIDAFAFVNYGEFDVQTILPFDFLNTLYITNYGLMQGLPGFQFDTARPSPTTRQRASTFLNDFGATITSFPISVGINVIYSPSYLLVSATNVFNQGLLSVSESGWLKLAGEHLDLSRGGLEVRPAVGGGFSFVTPTNFYPDVGLVDIWWGGETNQTLDCSTLLSVTSNSVTFTTPQYLVTNSAGRITFDQFQLRNPMVGVYTNRVDETNLIVQAAFVGFPTNTLSSRIHFTGFGSVAPPFQTISAELSMTETNIVTDRTFQDTLYLTDMLASSTNYVFLTNLLAGTFRPATYDLVRSMPFEFRLGDLGNAKVITNLLYDGSYSNTIVTNFYAGYAADVLSVADQSVQVPGTTITNSPGKVEIFSKDVNLEDTRIRGNSLVSIQTDHLVSSAKTKVEAPSLMFNLTSTNGNLTVQNLTRESILQFQGPIYAWSGLWTNQTGTLSTNVGPDPNDPALIVTNIVTNVVNIGFHVLALDARSLAVQPTPVLVYEMTARSTNVVINDNMNVVQKLLIDADSWTLNGRLTFSAGSGYFGDTNTPGLRFFTNNGTFTVGNVATFGSDRPTPYASVVNKGTMNAAAHVIRADYFQNSGRITDTGPLRLEAGIAKLEGGRNDAGNDIVLGVRDLKMHRYTNAAVGRVLMTVTNSLTDTGGGANNLIVAARGVQLLRKPPLGDLLGTEVSASTSKRELVPYVWAAEDRGASVTGYSNNVALGRLTLSAGQEGLLAFHAPSPQGRYGLYVDEVDLAGFSLSSFQTNGLASTLRIDPNLTLYFAYANVPVEKLDGQLGGRLRWVRDFTGPNSSVAVALPSGRTILVNRGLRESPIIDSDGDGIANGSDLTPFPDTFLQATVLSAPVPMTVLQWTAAPLTSYRVEYTADLMKPVWNVLATVTNSDPTPRVVTVQDPREAGGSQRCYRVSYNP